MAGPEITASDEELEILENAQVLAISYLKSSMRLFHLFRGETIEGLYEDFVSLYVRGTVDGSLEHWISSYFNNKDEMYMKYLFVSYNVMEHQIPDYFENDVLKAVGWLKHYDQIAEDFHFANQVMKIAHDSVISWSGGDVGAADDMLIALHVWDQGVEEKFGET